MSLEPSYEFANGPPAMTWGEYKPMALDEYRRLLASAPSEKQLQVFFQRNPSFVPGANGDGCCIPENHPFALITQPPLNGVTGRVPDFMWLTNDSHCVYPVLIEIERPGKRIFKQNGTELRYEFTQARNQLTQWRTWFSNPTNWNVFVERFGKHRHLFFQMASHGIRPIMILVYGRRSEFETNVEMTQHRAHLLNWPEERLISFDRLEPDPGVYHFPTVRENGAGRYVAVSIPPTFRITAFQRS